MSEIEQEIQELRAANRDLRQHMQRLEARMHQLMEEHAAVLDAVSRYATVDSES